VLQESGSGWVMVFPRGKHYINKYNIVLDCNDKFFNSVKSWWENSTFKKPFLDKGHEFNERYGEFTDYRITDKGLELYLNLNDEGKELVKSGKYEYLSPTFTDAADSNGEKYKNVIFSVSLVNNPALLVLDKIQNQIALSFNGDEEFDTQKKGGSTMELREVIAGKLSLSLAADDSSILTKIEELIKSGATVEDLMAKIQMMKDELAGAKEELAVAQDEKKKACDELSVIKAEAEKAEAEKVIDEAIKCGQFHPALKELKLSQYMSSKDDVLKELSVLPKVENKVQSTSSGVIEGSFSELDKAILLSVDYDLNDPKDIKLANEYLKLQGGK
jgi:hypothetical protein